MIKSQFLLLVCFIPLLVFSQDKNGNSTFIRLYEDNDGVNFFQPGTDWGYTNGTRIDVFREHKKGVRVFLSTLAPSAGPGSTTSSGLGLMQVMITPAKTRPAIPDKDDYSYAGGLFFIYTIHSANELKKLNVQTEWLAGVMGPPSFAEQTQIFLHRIIKDPRPNGWDYQLPADPLLNYQLTMEKQLARKGSIALIGGGRLSAGTLSDAVSCFAIFRFHRNLPWFSGLQKQYINTSNRKPGIAISIKPSVDMVFYNALLDGGLFNKNSPVNNKNSPYASTLKRNIVTGQLDIALLASYREFSITLIQKAISPEYKGYSSHQVGNITFCIGF